MPARLHDVLQLRLTVYGDGAGRDLLQLRREQLEDELARLGDASVQEGGADQRLQPPRQVRRARPPARHLLAAAQDQVIAKRDSLGGFSQRVPAYQQGADLAQVALAQGRVVPVQPL